jgi:hypothetical protein
VTVRTRNGKRNASPTFVHSKPLLTAGAQPGNITRTESVYPRVRGGPCPDVASDGVTCLNAAWNAHNSFAGGEGGVWVEGDLLAPFGGVTVGVCWVGGIQSGLTFTHAWGSHPALTCCIFRSVHPERPTRGKMAATHREVPGQRRDLEWDLALLWLSSRCSSCRCSLVTKDEVPPSL